MSNASLNFSAEIALVFSRSSINMRICKSRAAHPRVNEAAVVLLIIVARQRPASATWTEQLNTFFLMADLLYSSGKSEILVCSAIDIALLGRNIWIDWGVRKRPARGWPLTSFS
jgi:hypothetical protein